MVVCGKVEDLLDSYRAVMKEFKVLPGRGRVKANFNFYIMYERLAELCKPIVKVGFFQKVMAKFSNLSNCHSCEPKIVPALLIPINNISKILAIL